MSTDLDLTPERRAELESALGKLLGERREAEDALAVLQPRVVALRKAEAGLEALIAVSDPDTTKTTGEQA